MGSIHRDTRDRQKAEAAAKVATIEAKLKEAGLDEKQIGRTPAYRQAVADLKKADERIKAIDAKEALKQSLAEKKAQGKVKKEKGKGKGKDKAAKGQDKPKKKKEKKK